MHHTTNDRKEFRKDNLFSNLLATLFTVAEFVTQVMNVWIAYADAVFWKASEIPVQHDVESNILFGI